MANFLVRVQLDGSPKPDVYDKLHALMSQLGLKLFITLIGSNGKSDNYATPHATYFGVRLENAAGVRDLVRQQVTKQVWTTAEVLVVQAADVAIWGKPL